MLPDSGRVKVPDSVPNELASMAVIRFSEQLLTSAVGSSSARLILSLLFQRNDSNSRGTLRLFGEIAQLGRVECFLTAQKMLHQSSTQRRSRL